MPETNIIEQLLQPLHAEQNGTAVKIDCFCRTYSMNGMLPDAITSNDKEVLAAPARLRASFSGKEAPIIPVNTYISEQTDDRLVYHHQASANNVVLDSRVTVERDGLIWVDLLIMPFIQCGAIECTREQAVLTFDGLVLELPISKENAELYHYWPAASDNRLSNSGSIPETGISLPFRPCLWVGNENAGLSFYAESDENWQCSDEKSVLTLTVTEDAALLRVRLLEGIPEAWAGHTADNYENALEPVSFSFGLQASPVRPYYPVGDYRKVAHTGFSYDEKPEAFQEEADGLAALGIKWHTFHEQWSMIQNYGLPQDEAKFKAVVDLQHKRGIKVMVYFGYEYSSCVPDFFDNYRKNVVRCANGTMRGGWLRLPPQRDYIVCYAGDYSETMLERCRHAMDEYGVDGIYTDGTYIPWGCANEKHGCGWTDRNGVRHETWPLRKVREHCKKLYIQTHARGGIIEAHQSGCVIPMILAYCDSYYDGEHIALTTDPVTGNLRPLTGKELIKRYMSESGSGIGAIRAEFTGFNIGVPCQFLACTNFNECVGLVLLYGVLPKPGGDMNNIRAASRHWEIMDTYRLTEKCFIPFWRKDCPVHCSDSRISCSVWDTPDGMMAVFVNLSGEAAETDFTCTKSYAEAVDLRDNTILSTAHIVLEDVSPVYVFLKKC